jgi:hypothetical protein
VELNVIPQSIGLMPNTSATSIPKLVGIQPIISLEDMVYPKTYYHHIIGDIHVDEIHVQK